MDGSLRYLAKIFPYLASELGEREPTMTGTILKFPLAGSMTCNTGSMMTLLDQTIWPAQPWQYRAAASLCCARPHLQKGSSPQTYLSPSAPYLSPCQCQG